MILSNAHTHSTYCDGKNTLEEMIQEAIHKGFHTLGFSGHSYLSFCDDYPMSLENTEKYKKEVKELKEKYKGIIDIVLGIEWDYYSDTIKKEDYEYAIGSVHHLYSSVTDQYYALDNTREEFSDCLYKGFEGNFEKMAITYFSMVKEMIETKPIEIVGHLDLMKKLNLNECFFKEDDPIYLEYAKKAIDAGIKKGCIFEINTGGIYRGYHKEPYPGKRLLEYIALHHGKVMINSDSHNTESIDFYFKEAVEYAKACGINEIYYLTKDGFKSTTI